jgi:hypothetical protein
VPVVPKRTSPGRFDKKMCSISVDPMPSITSTPVRAVQARATSSGSASPADVHSRSASSLAGGKPSYASSEL